MASQGAAGDRRGHPPAAVDPGRRVVDFWCMHRPSATGKALNYFIELKKAYYCVSNGTNEDLAADAANRILEAVEQVSLVRRHPPDWNGDGSVYLAMPVIHRYHSASRSVAYNERHPVDGLGVVLQVADPLRRSMGRQNRNAT